MSISNASEAYRVLSTPEQERLFLDILMSPSFADTEGWGARFQSWLEEQAAEGLTLGEIARRMEMPHTDQSGGQGAWRILDDHVTWMIERGHARVVRIEIIA